MLVFAFFGYLKKSDLFEVSTDELLRFTFGIKFFFRIKLTIVQNEQHFGLRLDFLQK
jgi:hypothetical protein